VQAYERWVPAIADRAPQLLASDAASRVAVLTKLPGVTPPLHQAEVHHDAGTVLRRFHEAEPGHVDGDWGARRIERGEQWLARADDLFDDDVLRWARGRIALLADAPPQTMVPVHSDWQCRNWLLHEGRVLAIDFERARWESWLHDVQRLWWREWADHPECADAFFAGYGRVLSDDERALLEAFSSFEQVISVVWATEHGDDAFAAEGRANIARAMGRTA